MIETKVWLALLAHTLVILVLILAFEPMLGLAIYGAWHLGMHIAYTAKLMHFNHKTRGLK